MFEDNIRCSTVTPAHVGPPLLLSRNSADGVTVLRTSSAAVRKHDMPVEPSEFGGALGASRTTSSDQRGDSEHSARASRLPHLLRLLERFAFLLLRHTLALQLTTVSPWPNQSSVLKGMGADF